jgi:hypothetical protein
MWPCWYLPLSPTASRVIDWSSNPLHGHNWSDSQRHSEKQAKLFLVRAGTSLTQVLIVLVAINPSYHIPLFSDFSFSSTGVLSELCQHSAASVLLHKKKAAFGHI